MKLIVISGPTACGKSRLALQLGQLLKSVIISADSRQIYQEFDIGTAKPSLAERQLVPHYMIDICHPKDNFTLAQYQQQATNIITKQPISLLVGGTGLYIKGISRGLKMPQVPPHPHLRQQLELLEQSLLYEYLTQVDRIAAQKIHPNDRVRTIRALEVFYVTGYPMSSLTGEQPPEYPILHIGLWCHPDTLGQRITLRTCDMIEAGLVEEVATLRDKYTADLPLLQTLGYQEILQYLQGEISLEKAIELIITHTCQFAKRQRTWFRAQPNIEWFEAESAELLTQTWIRIQKFLRSEIF